MDMSTLNTKLHLLQLVLLLVHHHFHVNLLAQRPNCNASCANLGNPIPYPFTSPLCPLSNSSSFLLSNCSSPLAIWKAFTDTISSTDLSQNIIGPPTVMGISRVNYSTYIDDLTWDSDLISHPNTLDKPACSLPVPAPDLSHRIPSSIDLTKFHPNTVRFSDNNVYLLFNCSVSEYQSSLSSDQLFLSDDQFLQANTQLCQSYQNQCTLMAKYYTTGQCVQLTRNRFSPSVHLALRQAIDNLDCTHFQFFVTKSGANDVAITEWSKSILQLQWTDVDCWTCVDSGGSCVLDSTNRTLEKCTNCASTSLLFDGGALNISETSYCKYTYGCDRTTIGICSRTLKIVVPVVVIFVLMLLLALCCLWRIRRRRSMKSIEKLAKFPKKSAWPRQAPSSGSDDSLNDLDLNSLSERPMEYSYSSIASATSSFSSMVGKGGFGVVFKGAFSWDDDQPDTQEIAVKVLEVKSKHSRKQFRNEVAIIGRIHHVNVVRLLGFCVEHEEHEMLVYEYVVNGSVDTWLFSSTKRGGVNDHAEKELEWGQRYGIALGVAKGLSYLHEECRHRIVHCDIKPQNILLDANMCPKIADFGLARLMSRDESRVVTLAKGTPGYMAPEFWVGGDIQLSTKADVYSYGMVLLELVSGRRNFALGCPRFPAVACEAAMRSDFDSIIDVRLLQALTPATQEQMFLMRQQVRTAVFVALWCIQEHPASRPCMSEVVQYLEGIAAVSEQPPRPAIASTSTSTLLPIGLDSGSHLQDLTPMSGGR